MSDDALLTRDQIDTTKAANRKAGDAVRTATACIEVCYAHTGRLDLDTAADLVALPLGQGKPDLRLVVAALAARCAHLEKGVDKDAVLALEQVRGALAGFDARREQ